MTIQDWGITWNEIEPHYDTFEYLCGTSGQAGNLNGKIQSRRQSVRGSALAALSDAAAKAGLRPYAVRRRRGKKLGYKPFPQPSGNMSQAYTNPLGVTLGPCTYCGFCEWFGCANYSKASPQTTVLPVLLRKSNFEARTELRSDPHQSRQYRQARDRRHLCRFLGRGIRAAGRSGPGVRFLAVQRAAPAAVRHRHALRSSDRSRPDRPQLHPSDNVDRARLLRQGQIQLQSVRRLRRDRDDHRRVQRRQFRPRPGRLCRRRLYRPGPDQRPADREHCGAARHAGLGLEMEAGDQGQLSVDHQLRRRLPWFDVFLSRQSI